MMVAGASAEAEYHLPKALRASSSASFQVASAGNGTVHYVTGATHSLMDLVQDYARWVIGSALRHGKAPTGCRSSTKRMAGMQPAPSPPEIDSGLILSPG